MKTDERRADRLIIPWLAAGLVAVIVLPFVGAYFCGTISLDEGFLISSGRHRCQHGIAAALMLQVLLWVFLVWKGKQIVFKSTVAIRWSILASIATVGIFAIYLIVFTISANQALFSADQDVTNVSTAIARTTWTDILPSPYVAAGSSRSFLAHHFSPTLLLFVPLYRAASIFSLPGLDHNLYNYALFIVFIAGIILWLYYAYRSLPRMHMLLPLTILPLLHSFLFFRQILSFHFEVMGLPLFALLLLSLRLQDRRDIPGRAQWLARSWPVIAVLLAGIKEDMGVYLGLFAGVFTVFEIIDHLRAHPFLNRRAIYQIVLESIKTSIYFRLGLIALGWTISAMLMRLWIAGDGAPGWESYWNVREYADRYPQFRKTPYTYIWILLSSGIWIFFSLRSTIVVLAILLIHVISGMPWHALLESHYSYTILPFLFAGSLRGLSNLSRWMETGRCSPAMTLAGIFLGTILTDYSLLRDRNHPYPLFAEHEAYREIKSMTEIIPADACVQSSFHVSALVPLHARPIPFTYYRGSPFEKSMPGAVQLDQYDRESGECKELYRLFYGVLSGELKKEMDSNGEVLAEMPGVILLWKWNH